MATVSRKAPTPAIRTLYESDFHAWAQQQAELIRSGRFGELDRDRLVEEVSELGKSIDHSLKSAYRLIAMHLLKLMFQPGKATESWRETVRRERSNVDDLLDSFPALKSKASLLFGNAYAKARKEAAVETGLPLVSFPADPPFTREQAEDRRFWPATPVPDAIARASGREPSGPT